MSNQIIEGKREEWKAMGFFFMVRRYARQLTSFPLRLVLSSAPGIVDGGVTQKMTYVLSG